MNTLYDFLKAEQDQLASALRAILDPARSVLLENRVASLEAAVTALLEARLAIIDKTFEALQEHVDAPEMQASPAPVETTIVQPGSIPAAGTPLEGYEPKADPAPAVDLPPEEPQPATDKEVDEATLNTPVEVTAAAAKKESTK